MCFWLKSKYVFWLLFLGKFYLQRWLSQVYSQQGRKQFKNHGVLWNILPFYFFYKKFIVTPNTNEEKQYNWNLYIYIFFFFSKLHIRERKEINNVWEEKRDIFTIFISILGKWEDICFPFLFPMLF